MFFRPFPTTKSSSEDYIPYLNPDPHLNAELNKTLAYLRSLDFLHMLNALDKLPLEQSVILAVEILGPRVIKIVGFENDEICIDIVGCQGEDTPEQGKVGQAFRSNPRRSDLKILNGDNAYPHGFNSPFDKLFEKYFLEPYLKIENQIIDNNNAPVEYEKEAHVVNIGNHDGNFQNPFVAAKNRTGYGYNSRTLQGEEVEINEVACTFRPRNKFTKVSEILALFMQDEIDINDLREIGWIMPFFYMSYIIGEVQFFFINSNTYLRDFLAWHQNKNTFRNQAEWFNQTYHESPKEKVFIMHNFLLSQGKRVKHSDVKHYLATWEIEALQCLLSIDSDLYSDLHIAAFRKQGFKFAAHVGAHDHMQTQITHDDIFQLIVGSGGGKPQRRKAYDLTTGHQFSGHGYLRLTYPLHEKNPALLFEFISLPIPKLGNYVHHVRFNSKTKALEQKEIQDKRLVALRDIFFKTTNKFLRKPNEYIERNEALLKAQQSFFWKTLDYVANAAGYSSTQEIIDLAHHLIAYLSQPELPDYDKVHTFINTYFADPLFRLILVNIEPNISEFLQGSQLTHSPAMRMHQSSS